MSRFAPSAPPTVDHFRGHGVTRLLIYCSGQREGGWPCVRHGRPTTISIDGFAGEATLLELAPKFLCTACGCRSVELRPDWSSQPTEHKGTPAVGWILPPSLPAKP